MTGRARAAAAGRVVLALAVAAAVGGCGYSLRGNLPSDIKTVGVPIFANRTPQPGVEGLITRAVVEAFVSNGRLRVVQPRDADAVLQGELTGYVVSAIAFNPNENITQYRLTVTLNLTFRDARRNTVLFEQGGFSEQADFRVLGPVSQTIALEETAVRQAAVEIARTVVSLAVTRF